MSKKPNIIIFNPDEFRADALGHLGNSAALTPNFDSIIKKDAVSFRNAFCQNPVCTPSRCSFMSGWYPHVRGHRLMYHLMQEDEPVLLRTLKENGYFVWWGGKNDLIPGQNSYDPYCDIMYKPKKPLYNGSSKNKMPGNEKDDYKYSFYSGKIIPEEEDTKYYDPDWRYINGAVDFINDHSDNKPFCIYLPLNYPHPPYKVEEPWYSCIDRDELPDRISSPESWKNKPSFLKSLYELQGVQDWTEEKWNELRATYLGMCSRVDYQFGLLIEALKETGQYDNTAIFVFSDHGDYTGDYGIVEKNDNTFEDCLVNVPFIIKPPAEIQINPGINDSLVELIDFPATVEELTGCQSSHNHFGKSLLPVLKGDSEEHRDVVFCEGGRLHCEEKCISPLTGDSLYWPRQKTQHSSGSEHTRAVMIRSQKYKYVRRLYEQDEFYDLINDPEELNNKINDPEYKVEIYKLKEKLLNFYLETSDVVPVEHDERNLF